MTGSLRRLAKRLGAVLFTGSRNAAGMAKRRELAGQIVAESNYTLTSDLYVYRHGAFRRFEP